MLLVFISIGIKTQAKSNGSHFRERENGPERIGDFAKVAL
jgi:hypothetical protein